MDLKTDAAALNPRWRRFCLRHTKTLSIKGCDGRILATAHARKAQSEK